MVQKLKLSKNVHTKIRVRIKYSEKKMIFRKIKTILDIERIILKIKIFVTSASISMNFKISFKPGHFYAKNDFNFVYPISVLHNRSHASLYSMAIPVMEFQDQG